MATLNNYKTENFNKTNDRYDVNNPSFNPSVSSKGLKEGTKFEQNLNKWVEFVSWARFFPDLFLDLITPDKGGIRLDLDQRVFLRGMVRFLGVYGVFPRGYGKTFIEILALYLAALFYPDSNLSMSAQTKEAAVRLVEEKHKEIIKFYPLLANEIIKASFSKDTAEVIFTSGSTIGILANQQSSKGSRRHRLMMEESSLINDLLYQDVLEPIVNIPRRTIGAKSTINPEEMNGQMHFLTTAYFKNSEYERCLKMLDDMAELKGKIVLGSDWTLACEYGRGETKTQILDKKERLSPIFFATNYESRWVGNSDNCLVDINKLNELRVLPRAELKGDAKGEYHIGVDVARSTKSSNNQTSIAIGKVKRDKEDRVKTISIVNIINLPQGLSFTSQAIAVKRLKLLYKAKTITVDINGLGIGLLEELMKSHIDPVTGEDLIAYETINTEHESDEAETEKCVFGLTAQGINTDIIVNFMSMVDSKKLQLLDKIDQNKVEANNDYLSNNTLAFVQTDFFIEEVANLSLKTLNGGKLTVERNTKGIDKDRYSAVAYLLYYIKTYEDKAKPKKTALDLDKLFQFYQPSIRKF